MNSKTNMINKFKVGDVIENVDSTADNYGLLAEVIGFHRIMKNYVYIRYTDGTFGCSRYPDNDYKIITKAYVAGLKQKVKQLEKLI